MTVISTWQVFLAGVGKSPSIGKKSGHSYILRAKLEQERERWLDIPSCRCLFWYGANFFRSHRSSLLNSKPIRQANFDLVAHKVAVLQHSDNDEQERKEKPYHPSKWLQTKIAHLFSFLSFSFECCADLPTERATRINTGIGWKNTVAKRTKERKNENLFFL